MIVSLLLAAGQSKRMGQAKMLLPWGETTVLGQVIATLQAARVDDILVVTGGARQQVEEITRQFGVRTIHNEDFANGEMLSSIQCGLKALTPSQPLPFSPKIGEMSRSGGGSEGLSQPEAILLTLGDQPQIQERSVRAVVDRFREGRANLVVPSFQMRRGHPWLVARPLWEELLRLRPPRSPRDFLNTHAAEIDYVNVENDSILADLDTPDDYLKSRP